MSFTYKMNKMGPRIVPWGTPDKTGDENEQVPRLVHGWFTLGEIL